MAKDSRAAQAATEDGAIPVDTTELLSGGYDKMRTPNSSEPAHGATHGADDAAANAGRSDDPPAGEDDADAANDLMHGINSFWALVYPICVTMILARCAVFYPSDALIWGHADILSL